MRMLMDDTAMERLADILMDFQKRENTDIPFMKKQLAETVKGIENMLNAIQQGIFNSSTKTRLDQLEETKAQLEVSILQAELEKPLISREQFLFWLHRFRDSDVANPAHRQQLVDSFVNAVYLYDDKVVMTFNYKDGTKTVTLQEVEGSDLGAGTAPSKKVKKDAMRSKPHGVDLFGEKAAPKFCLSSVDITAVWYQTVQT